MIRGKGATKEGKLSRLGLPQPGEDEPLHALITATTPDAVKVAVDKVRGTCVHICTSLCLSVCVSVCLLCLYFYLYCLNSVTLLTFALLHVSLLRSRTSYSLVLMSPVMTMTSRGSRCCSWQSSMEHSNHLIYSGDVRNYDNMQGFSGWEGAFTLCMVCKLLRQEFHLGWSIYHPCMVYASLEFCCFVCCSIGYKYIVPPQNFKFGCALSCNISK